jgi:hypothetical protein
MREGVRKKGSPLVILREEGTIFLPIDEREAIPRLYNAAECAQ